MRVEALSDGVRRCWAAVVLEGVSANQKDQIDGPLASHSVQPDKIVMHGCEGRILHLDRTQSETSRCGLYNRPPPCTADRTLHSLNDWRFNLKLLIQLRMSLPRPPVQLRALVVLVRSMCEALLMVRFRFCSHQVQHHLMVTVSQQQVMTMWVLCDR